MVFTVTRGMSFHGRSRVHSVKDFSGLVFFSDILEMIRCRLRETFSRWMQVIDSRCCANMDRD